MHPPPLSNPNGRLAQIGMRAAIFAALLVTGGCAMGDFDRLRPSLTNDDMHAWVGRDAVGAIGGQPSDFKLTDDERLLRDLAYPLIEPPYDRGRWYSVIEEYGLSRKVAPNQAFDRTAYWLRLDESHRRSEVSAYARITTDAQNDVARLGPFFAAANRIAVFDGKRGAAIAHISGTSGVSDHELANAQARANENAAVIAWACRSLHERTVSYAYALDRLVVTAPSRMAAETERALDNLARQAGQYCLGPQPRMLVAKD